MLPNKAESPNKAKQPPLTNRERKNVRQFIAGTVLAALATAGAAVAAHHGAESYTPDTGHPDGGAIVQTHHAEE